MENSKLVSEYQIKTSTYDSLARRTAALIENLLDFHSIQYHVVECRAKTVESLSEKLKRPNKEYDGLDQIPDLAGIRVICYYHDDCRKIADLVESEFDVREKEDGHSQDQLDADRFGYLSVHRVVCPSLERTKLTEWKVFEGLQCEIQIRTVIQHAWAAVSHQVQYKLEKKTPTSLRRRLNRIASLFELADEQFVTVRDERKQLADDLKKGSQDADLLAKISPTAIRVGVDKWVVQNNVVDNLRECGFQIYGIDDDENDNWVFDETIIGDILDLCKMNGILRTENLFSKVGGFNSQYMQAQWEAEKTKNWIISPDFCFLLHCLKELPKTPTLKQMTEGEWGEDTAKRVMKVAKAKAD